MFQTLAQVSCWSGLLCKGTPQDVLSLVKDVPIGSKNESKQTEEGNYCILLPVTHINPADLRFSFANNCALKVLTKKKS